MKQKKQSLVLLTLAALSLLSIGIIFTTGALKGKPKVEEKKPERLDILGEMAETKISQPSSVDVNRFLEEAAQDTKEAVSQKVTEVEKAILTTIQEKISDLTQSQIKALQYQICKDWEVITPAPH